MRYYKRFSNCYPVCGYRNFAVYDISRKAVFEIEKQTFELLGLEIISEQLLQSLPNKQFYELLEKEIIFQCNFGDENLFPPIENCWFSPFSIISCIIDWEKNSQYDITKGIEQLVTIGCKTLQLRFGSGVEENKILNILDRIAGGNIRSVEMILCFDENLLKKITKEFEFVVSIIAYSANQTTIKVFNSCHVVLTKEIFFGSDQCGIVSPSYFICNSDFFFESINHNTCLNRKISIDSNGNIKNCPSCIQSYGNINDTNIA
jgi:hypothetical protein